MSYARQLLDSYPREFNLDAQTLAATIDALSDCAPACTACADDCLSERRCRAGQVHPAVPGRRRRLHRHAAGPQPPDRLRRQPHPAAAAGVRGGLHQLWGRMQAARRDARALPGVRRGLPALRAGLHPAADPR
jgi:hypothetical protein